MSFRILNRQRSFSLSSKAAMFYVPDNDSDCEEIPPGSPVKIITEDIFEKIVEEQKIRKDSVFVMLQSKLQGLIQEGLVEGQRFALSSDLWRYATSTTYCDLLLTLKPNDETNNMRDAVIWIVELIKKHEPSLRIEVRHHKLTDCYAIYLTADYKTLLKGAELCHLKKPVKNRFGGGLREFCFEDAQCFTGIEGRNTFLTSMERALIVKQMVELIRAGRDGLTLTMDTRQIVIPEGGTVVYRLISCNIIDNLLPLHSTEYLNHLQQKWVLSLEEQPIEQIKEYFGTEISMYFAWLGHMTTALWFPALLGLFMFFFGGFKYKHETEDLDKQDASQLFSDICFVGFAFFNCVWSTAYLELWKRKQAELSFKWGTYDAEADSYLQDPRPQFRGDTLAPNPVSGRLEPFYPPWKHVVIRYGLTYPVTLLCVLCMFLAMLMMFAVQDATDFYFGGSLLFHWICYLPMVVYALMIVVSDKLYRHLALFLNDLENYRTDDEYEDFLTSKIVIFQFVTAFGSLFYIAFILKDMKRLQETLATLLITRQVTQNVMETAVPFVLERLKLSSLTYKMTRSMSDSTLRRHVEDAKLRRHTVDNGNIGSTHLPSFSSFFIGSSTMDSIRKRNTQELGDADSHKQLPSSSSSSENCNRRTPRLPMPEFRPSNNDGPELSQAELESLMTVYERPLDDYLEMFIQFGYVLLFSPAFPLAAACALLNNLIEIRVDAFKLCNTVQRPLGRQVSDIGAWQKAMQVLGIVGVIVNCALIGQSGLVQRIWPDLSWGGQMLIVVVLEHIILALKVIIDLAVPDVPHWVRIETAKQEHYRREAFKREARLLSGKLSPQNSQTTNTTDFENVLMEARLPRNPSRRSMRRSITPMVRMGSHQRFSNNSNCIDS